MGITYSPKIVTGGLIGCWDVGNPRSSPGEGTTWTDLSKNGNNGTLINGPITAKGINQGIISFDGTDDYVSIGNPSEINFNQQDFTVECWFYHTSNDGSFTDTILSKWDQSERQVHLHVRDASSGGADKLQWETGDGSSDGGVLGVTSIATDTWYHVIGTYSDASTPVLSLYLNGEIESTGNGVRVGTGTSDWIVGGRDTSISQDEEWRGNISSVRVYNRVLTTAEIKQNYNATKGRFSVTTPSIVKENLVLHLDAGDSDSYPGTGTTWTDLSGNGHNATLYNGPTFSSSNGGEIVFDGGNDYGIISHHSDLNISYGSVEAWINLRQSSWSWNFAWTKENGTREANLASLYTPSSSSGQDNWISCVGDSSSQNWCVSNPGTINYNQWVHVVVTFNSNDSISQYFNGILSSTNSSVGSTATNSENLNLAKRKNGSNLNVSFAIFRIYGKELTSGEVLQNYEAQKGRFV